MYVAETAQHLKEARELFSDKRVLSEEELYKAMARFHTIKGGAGFFGFHDIAKVAGKLELLLKESPEQVFAKTEIVRSLITDLETLTNEG